LEGLVLSASGYNKLLRIFTLLMSLIRKINFGTQRRFENGELLLSQEQWKRMSSGNLLISLFDALSCIFIPRMQFVD